jgi:hypothetical protein
MRNLYLTWRKAVAERSSRGELRATAAESEALERFVRALDAATEEEREAWEQERVALDAEGGKRCACGHPGTHHDSGGSCFHVVGCATGCDCAPA